MSHPQTQQTTRSGRMPWPVKAILALATLLLLAFIVLVIAVILVPAAPAPEPEPPAVTQPTTAAPAPEPTTDPDQSLRDLNAQRPADQEAYLNGLLEDARDAYLSEPNEVLLAVGLAVCLKYDQGESTAEIVAVIPDQFTGTAPGYIVGHAVENLCPEHIPAVEEDLSTSVLTGVETV